MLSHTYGSPGCPILTISLLHMHAVSPSCSTLSATSSCLGWFHTIASPPCLNYLQSIVGDAHKGCHWFTGLLLTSFSVACISGNMCVSCSLARAWAGDRACAHGMPTVFALEAVSKFSTGNAVRILHYPRLQCCWGKMQRVGFISLFLSLRFMQACKGGWMDIKTGSPTFFALMPEIWPLEMLGLVL